MIPKNITKDHIEKAIQEIDENGIRKGRHSSTYDLVVDGKAYPPKLVISIANRFANGEELNPDEFAGGLGTEAFAILEGLNYDIVKKADPLGSEITKGDKWKELLTVVRKINDETAVRKFFGSVAFVLHKLELALEDPLVYATSIKDNIQFTVGSRYVVNVNRKAEKVYLGYYIKKEYLSDIKTKYPDLINDNEWKNDDSERVWIRIESGYADETDFHNGILALALESKQRQSKSNFRSYYSDQHNPCIIEVALNKNKLDELFTKYYLLGAYWNSANPQDQTERFVRKGIWENGYDDKFIEEVKAVPIGSKVAIKSTFVREKTRSVMAIKTKGTVTENAGDGRNLNIVWDSEFEPFEVSFTSGYRATIEQVKNQAHIDEIWHIQDAPKNEEMTFSLNTIFYGPPGTGKTYNTVLRAAEIIQKRRIDDYREALRIFKEQLHEQIEFITFHQNYSYEDFIQGLRPELDNQAALTFIKKDGVFKKIAERALENLRQSEKAPEEISSEALFETALEKFIDELQDSDENYAITPAAYIFEVEDEAFRYTGEKWTNHASGLRMKFNDLREFYRSNVKSRKDVKKLNTISGLANQHASYYFLVYQKILEYLPEKVEAPQRVERKNYVLVIDEINRANISRVFGELITLIEPDKRSGGSIRMETILPSGDKFMVPSNLYIIGTMNTADKSIALLDIALRRRFEFEAMYPQYEIQGYDVLDKDILQKINEQIIKSKGYDFQIGHAYFMGENKDLVQRMNKKVIPLLLEYYMNDEKEVKSILANAGLALEDNSWPIKITGRRDQPI